MRDRSAFGYMEPDSNNTNDFAQCGSCQLFLVNKENCYWYSKNKKVEAEDSCIMYVPGQPIEDDIEPVDALTPKETGFHQGQVRCQNCSSFNKDLSACNLYAKLNKQFPQLFKLVTSVKPRACCNAWD